MVYGEPYLPDYEEVYSVNSGGYDWAELRVFEKDGRLFFGSGSGCSCTYFEEQVTESDLIELPTLESGRNALKDFFDGTGRYHFTDVISNYLDGVEKLRELGLR